LPSDGLVGSGIDGFVDLTHPTVADQAAEVIRADRLIAEPSPPVAERALQLVLRFLQQRFALRDDADGLFELVDRGQRRLPRRPRDEERHG